MFPLFDDQRIRRRAVVTLWLVVGCVVFFILELRQPSIEALERFVRTWGLVPAELDADDPRTWPPLMTHAFLHGGLIHLVGNLWFLWLFGRKVESALGRSRFIFLYGFALLAAAAAQIAVAPQSAIPMIGASGAVSGVLGAYFVLFPRAVVYALVPLWFAPVLPVPAFVFMLAWFAGQAFAGIGVILDASLEGGIAWWAHIGGFVAGIASAGALRRRRKR